MIKKDILPIVLEFFKSKNITVEISFIEEDYLCLSHPRFGHFSSGIRNEADLEDKLNHFLNCIS